MTRRKTPVPNSPMKDEPNGGPVRPLVTDTGAEVVVGPMCETPIAPDGQPEMQPSDPPDAPDTAPVPTTFRKQARSPGVFGPVIGGFLAAVAGFGLAHFNFLGLQPSDRSDEIAALTERQASMTSGMAELQDRIAALEARPEPEGPDLSRLDDLDQRLQAVEAAPPSVGTADTTDLAARLAALEKAVATLPKGNGDPAEIEAALAQLAELQAAAEAQTAAMAEVARAAEEARTLAALAEAMETGNGFEDELAAITNPDLKAALAPHTVGVTPLAQLQAAFPEAARAALQLARRTDGDDSWGSRLTDFLADQTGARSVTPRDGDDPDAILSRAEFALGEGRLPDALTELSSLAPDIRAPLEDWIAKAAARVAVDNALTEAM